MTSLPVDNVVRDCWNSIGVRGDRSCPELAEFVHCQNCPVFAAAGRRFLDAGSPDGYLDEWTARLAEKPDELPRDTIGVLVFRLADEWLALPIQVLVEVTVPRPVHRVPYRAGLLAGLVNIRGELHLCIHLAKLLGIVDRSALVTPDSGETPHGRASPKRYLVTHREADRWVFPVDAVDQVCRISLSDVKPVPATVNRAAHHLSSGMFSWSGRPVGLLDDARVFETLQRKLR
jgi:chemotaxis-related protein WspD